MLILFNYAYSKYIPSNSQTCNTGTNMSSDVKQRFGTLSGDLNLKCLLFNLQ